MGFVISFFLTFLCVYSALPLKEVYAATLDELYLYIDLNLDESDVNVETLNNLSTVNLTATYAESASSTPSVTSGTMYCSSNAVPYDEEGLFGLLDDVTQYYFWWGIAYDDPWGDGLLVDNYHSSQLDIKSIDLTAIYNQFLSTNFSLTGKHFLGFSIYLPNSEELSITSENNSCILSTAGVKAECCSSVGGGGSQYAYVLKANWGNADGSQNAVAIQYKNPDGTAIESANLSSGTPSLYTGENIDLSSVSATKTGYTFSGWYDNAQCEGTAITSLSGTYSSAIVLYAKWVLKKQDITINLTITGLNNYVVIIYILQDNQMKNQIARTESGSFVIQQDYGQNFTLQVCRSYMWTLNVTGSGTFDGVCYKYAVNDENNQINISLSGGTVSNNIIVL